MQDLLDFSFEIKQFLIELLIFITKKLHLSFLRIEAGKGVFVSALYRQRGKKARQLIHTGMAGLAGVGMMIAPVIAQEFPGRSVNPWEVESSTSVLSATTSTPEFDTLVSEKSRDKITEYKVEDGDTLAGVAKKFGISTETIKWQNNLTSDTIKPGQILQILPVTGIAHKVQKGDTVYSIAKKYDSDAQAIAVFPFNTFSNDETFELAIGQTVIVPEGVKKQEAVTAPRMRRITPDAGAVVASGQFVWPTNGQISQNYAWYHPGLDVANRGLPNVLAADSGSVVYAGCIAWGYGCHVIIDHANGYRTLYAHLSQIYVTSASGSNRIGKGQALGKMGSTGRSTGPHLHFEISRNGVKLNPLSILR